MNFPTLVKPVSVALALSGLVFPAAAVEGQSKSVGDELRVFTRILNATLEHHDLNAGYVAIPGASPFDTGVQSSYVPTVGAIITVPVDFPIVEIQVDQQAPEVEKLDLEQDLWDHFSRDRRERRSDSNPPPPPGPGGPQPGGPQPGGPQPGGPQPGGPQPGGPQPGGPELEGPPPGHGPGPGPGPHPDPERVEREFRDQIRVHIAEGQRGDSPVIFMPDFQLPKYDAGRVEKLREAVIGTLAKYGHRLGSLPADERILVIVEAPKAARPYRAALAGKMQGEKDAGETKEDGRKFRDVLRETDVEVFRKEDKGWTPGSLIAKPMSFFRGQDARDRLLFSVSKSELAAEVAPATLRPLIKEVAY